MRLKGEEMAVRIAALTMRLIQGEPVTASYIRKRFNVSWATAKRDLIRLEGAVPTRLLVRSRNSGYLGTTHELVKL